jgi:hypothetical protein
VRDFIWPTDSCLRSAATRDVDRSTIQQPTINSVLQPYPLRAACLHFFLGRLIFSGCFSFSLMLTCMLWTRTWRGALRNWLPESSRFLCVETRQGASKLGEEFLPANLGRHPGCFFRTSSRRHRAYENRRGQLPAVTRAGRQPRVELSQCSRTELPCKGSKRGLQAVAEPHLSWVVNWLHRFLKYKQEII